MLTPDERARLLELIDRVELADKCCEPENAATDANGWRDFDVMCGKCPYNGKECEGVEDPKRRDTWEAFELARKAIEEEPARLLTVEEIQRMPIGAVIWEETICSNELQNDMSIDRDIEPLVMVRKGHFEGHEGRKRVISDDMYEYFHGTTRWWSSMPTKMQMITTPWEKKLEETDEAD